MNKYLSSKYLRLLAASGLFAIFLTPATLTAQVAQTNTGESALFRGEQLLLTGSYAAASDIFQMADGLDRNEGLVGASRAFAMMGNYQEAMNVVEAAKIGRAHV